MRTMMTMICIIGMIGIIRIPARNLNSTFGHVRKQEAVSGIC